MGLSIFLFRIIQKCMSLILRINVAVRVAAIMKTDFKNINSHKKTSQAIAQLVTDFTY